MRLGILILTLLLLNVSFCHAGWLTDKLESAGKSISEQINKVSGESDEADADKSPPPARDTASEPPSGNRQYGNAQPGGGSSHKSSTRKVRTDLHFSGDTEMADPKSMPEPMTGKMFVDGARMRWDMNTSQGSMSTIITGSDPGDKIFTLMHGQKMYMSTSVGQSDEDYWETVEQGENPCEGYQNSDKQGSTKLNGRKVVHWECSSPENRDMPESLSLWIDKRLGIPIRTNSSDGTRWELKNVSESRPDAKTFEIPSGYKAFSLGNMSY